MSKILVFSEVSAEGKPSSAALEILTKARELDSEVEAIALGPGASGAAPTLGEYGAKRVHVSDDATYAEYPAGPASLALEQVVRAVQPTLMVFAFEYDSRDIAARLAARLGSTIMSNATDLLSLERAQVAIFGGTEVVDIDLKGQDPKIVLVRPKSFEATPSSGTAEVVQIDFQVPEEAKKAKRVERHEEVAAGPKLEEATVIISGGRGLQEPGNFKLLEEVAQLIGRNAAVGATRAVVDAGWVPYSMQIGQTGKTVKPGVYIAIGISGATQHLVGMKNSKAIIAINKDPEAPIFKIADLGVVGDALKILPQLMDEIKARKG